MAHRSEKEKQREWERKMAREQAIDEAIKESFPASDPPAFIPVTSVGPHQTKEDDLQHEPQR